MAALVAFAAMGCSDQSVAGPRNPLDAMRKSTVVINGHTFEVWLALTADEQQTGLMNVPAEDLADIDASDMTDGDASDGDAATVYRGMLFAFDDERPLGFWMLNTITALDIAYISADGRIVSTYMMAPLETRVYPSIEPARFALEVRAGLFAELGIAAGDHVEIPDSVLKADS